MYYDDDDSYYDAPRPRGRRVRERDRPILIEQTAKKYKVVQLIGFFITLAGASMLMAGIIYHERTGCDGLAAIGMGLVVTFLGIMTSAAARVGAWWDHG